MCSQNHWTPLLVDASSCCCWECFSSMWLTQFFITPSILQWYSLWTRYLSPYWWCSCGLLCWSSITGRFSGEWIKQLTRNALRTFFPKRYQQTTQDISRRFRIYFCSVFGVILLTIIFTILDEMRFINFRRVTGLLDWIVSIFFLSFISADVILLLSTGYMVFKLSKASRSRDHAWFEAEKERYG